MRSKLARKAGKASAAILYPARARDSARRASLTTSHASSPMAGGSSTVKKLASSSFSDLHESVELRHRGAEELVAELLGDVVEAGLGVLELLGRLVLEELELLDQLLVVAREHQVQGLRAEAHGLRLVLGAADPLAQLALEEEAREALGRLGDLALDGGSRACPRGRGGRACA